MTEVVRRIEAPEVVFGLEAASRLIAEIAAPWVQDLGLLVESVEASRPPGAPDDWQPGACLRMPFTSRISRDGGVACGHAVDRGYPAREDLAGRRPDWPRTGPGATEVGT